VHRGGRRRRLIEDARVVQEREEQVEEVLARREAADVAAQERGRALEHALAHASNAAWLTSPTEPNSHDRKRNGSASSARTLASACRRDRRRRVVRQPTRPTSASARVSRASP
jgi:hypothetical protein